VEKIDDLKAALERGGGRVLVGYQFRHHPALRQIADFLAEEAIGRPLSVRAHWGEYLPDWHPWEDYRKSYSARKDLGGGVILTLSHTLDYLRWMFGEVDSLWAFVGKLSDLEIEVEDTAEIGLRFSSGLIGSLHLNYNQHPPAHHIQVVGTQGTIQWENPDEIVRIYRAGSKEWEDVYSAHGFKRNDMFLAQMHHFREVVRGTAEPICTLEDGIHALELSLAALQSAESGQMKSFGE
jgi:predicted dehydrogenase